MSTAPAPTHACLRSIPHSSMTNAATFSKMQMTVESDAKLRNRKNSVPHTPPKGICPNTVGSATNTRLGPEAGSTP